MSQYISNNDQLELVKKLRKGNSFAFEALYDQYSGKLFHFVNRYLGVRVESEEIVQDVFFSLWNNRGNLKSEAAFKSYIYTMALNRVKNYFARKRMEEKHKQNIALEFIIQNEEEAEKLDYQKVMAQVDELIETLPQRQREVFLLSRKEGLTIAEIASYLNISANTVKNQLTSAVSSLKTKAIDRGMLDLLLFLIVYK